MEPDVGKPLQPSCSAHSEPHHTHSSMFSALPPTGVLKLSLAFPESRSLASSKGSLSHEILHQREMGLLPDLGLLVCKLPRHLLSPGYYGSVFPLAVAMAIPNAVLGLVSRFRTCTA